jgi:hypothetical protein
MKKKIIAHRARIRLAASKGESGEKESDCPGERVEVARLFRSR